MKLREIYCIQAGELELMAKFARAHNASCSNALGPSHEDGKPYCRYQVETTNSGIGQNYYLECRECGVREPCTEGWNG